MPDGFRRQQDLLLADLDHAVAELRVLVGALDTGFDLVEREHDDHLGDVRTSQGSEATGLGPSGTERQELQL